MIEEKILYGFNDIYICRADGIPIHISGGLSVDIQLKQNYEYGKCGVNKTIRFNGPLYGVGKLTLLNLTLEEQSLLFGYIKDSNGGVSIESVHQPNLSLLFSRSRKDGHKLLYCIYNVMFKPTSITANTHTDLLNEDTLTVEFDVFTDFKTGLTYYVIDTKNGNNSIINNWFKQVQYPNR